MIFTEAPQDFKKSFEVSGCLVECGSRILLLLRQDHKPQGNTWCLPSGKLNNGETPRQAIVREVFEETERVFPEDRFEFVRTFFVRYDEYDFVYHVFRVPTLSQKVVLRHGEHKDYIWVTPKGALSVNLIKDEDECIRLSYPQAI